MYKDRRKDWLKHYLRLTVSSNSLLQLYFIQAPPNLTKQFKTEKMFKKALHSFPLNVCHKGISKQLSRFGGVIKQQNF